MKKKSVFYIVMAAFLFATMETVSKVAGAAFNALQLVCIRFIVGGVILLPFSIVDLRWKKYKLTIGDWMYLSAIGVMCIISMVMLQYGVQKINANLAAVIFCTNPLFTTIFAHFIVKEKITVKKILVLTISTIGLMIVVNPIVVLKGKVDGMGVFITIMAAVIFGLYTTVGKLRLKKIGGMGQNSISFLIGSVALLIFMEFNRISIVQGVTIKTLPVLAYLGFFVTGIGYYCFTKAIELSGPSSASIAFFIKPILAPIISIIILHELPTLNFIIGVLIISIGFYINYRD